MISSLSLVLRRSLFGCGEAGIIPSGYFHDQSREIERNGIDMVPGKFALGN